LGVIDLSQPCERVHECENGEPPARDAFDRLLRQPAAQAVLGQRLHHFLGIAAEFLVHRFLDHGGETLAPLVPLDDKRLNLPPDLVQCVADLAVCLRVKSITSTASHTMWLAQAFWNQNI
jgi:hypothetical protein